MSDELKVLSRARVSVTVEVVISQPWSDEATIGYVWSDARREALERITNALGKHTEIRILGEPVVTAVLSQERRP